MKSIILTLVAISVFAFCVSAQDSASDAHYKQIEEKYRKMRDSLLKLHPLIPAVSSVVMNYQQVEIIFYNSLITASKTRNNQGDLTPLGVRVSYLYSTLQATYGISKNSRFNVGLDVNLRAGRVDPDENSSPVNIFNSSQATAVASIGPRIRWRPFKGDYRFTVQSSLSFPTGISSANEKVIGVNRIIFQAQALYNQPLSKRLFLFTQATILYSGQKSYNPEEFLTPISAYLSYLIPKKTIIFAVFNYVPIFYNNLDNKDWYYYGYTFQIGAGLQYQISQRFLVNGYYTRDLVGRNYQGFNNYNLSVRYASL